METEKAMDNEELLVEAGLAAPNLKSYEVATDEVGALQGLETDKTASSPPSAAVISAQLAVNQNAMVEAAAQFATEIL
jgi:hypothetical protein